MSCCLFPQLFASGGGGCCDCGDPEAWTSCVHCDLHKPTEQNEDEVACGFIVATVTHLLIWNGGFSSLPSLLSLLPPPSSSFPSFSPSLLFSSPPYFLPSHHPHSTLPLSSSPSSPLPSHQVDPVEALSSDLADRARVFFSTLLWYCLDILCWQETKTLPAMLMKGRSAER